MAASWCAFVLFILFPTFNCFTTGNGAMVQNCLAARKQLKSTICTFI
jgi:hypothetical protein